MDYKDFLLWEQTTRDTIDLKKIYVDVAGDLVSGVLLSQIVYWNLPNREGQTKLRVIIDDELWLAKGREEWWEECRVSPKQFDRSIKILEKKGIVTTKIKKFDGSPTKHIRLNLENLINNMEEILKSCDSLVFTQTVKTNLPKGEKRICPNGKNEFTQTVKSLTETKTKTKTKTKNIESSSVKVKNDEEENIKIKEILEHCQLLNFKLRKGDIKTLLTTYTLSDIIRAITTIANTESFINGEIKNNKAYLIKTLNNFKVSNTVIVNSNSNKDINSKKLKFIDYSQREYDFDKLENDLLEIGIEEVNKNEVIENNEKYPNTLKEYLKNQA